MKTTLSKTQWEYIGKKTGWLKTAKFSDVPSQSIHSWHSFLKEKIGPLFKQFKEQKQKVANFIKKQMQGKSSTEEYEKKKAQYMELLSEQNKTWNLIKQLAAQGGERDITEQDLNEFFKNFSFIRI